MEMEKSELYGKSQRDDTFYYYHSEVAVDGNDMWLVFNKDEHFQSQWWMKEFLISYSWPFDVSLTEDSIRY